MKLRFFLSALLIISAVSFSETNTDGPNNQNMKMEMPDSRKITKEEFYKKMSLTKEQEGKMDKILDNFDKMMKSNMPKDKDDMKKEMDSMINDLNTKAKSVLNESQYKIYQNNIQSYLLPPGPPPIGDKK